MQQYGSLITYRDVTRPTPAKAVPTPFLLPAVVIERLRSLKAQYDATLDAALMMSGHDRGGCALDLRTGWVYPPGTLPQEATDA